MLIADLFDRQSDRLRLTDNNGKFSRSSQTILEKITRKRQKILH